jgi:hypothetical protein
MNGRGILFWLVHGLAAPLAIGGILIAGFMAATVIAIGVGP